jgi:putative ABC transport system permease protein
MVLSMAWRNIWRQPRRTLLSATAVMLTSGLLIFLPALQIGSYQAMVNASIGILDGVVQIQRPDYLESPTMRLSFKPELTLAQTIKQQIDNATLAQRANGFALVSSEQRSFGLQVIGVEADKEPLFSSIPGNIRQGRYLHASPVEGDDGEIVLGEVLAKNLRVTIGDSVTLLGSGRDGSLAADSLVVVGIFSTGMKAIDRQLAQMPISRFDETFAMQGQIHAWVVINDTQSLMATFPPNLTHQLAQQKLAIRDWQLMQPALLNAIKLDISSAFAMYLVLILVIVFSLVNSSLMSVLERTREFGMVMALGVKTGLLGQIIWVESFLVMTLGVLSGVVVGGIITYYYQSVGITFSGAEVVFEQFGLTSTIHPLLNWISLLVGPAVIGLSLALAGIYPSLRIRRLEIVAAMRSV